MDTPFPQEDWEVSPILEARVAPVHPLPITASPCSSTLPLQKWWSDGVERSLGMEEKEKKKKLKGDKNV